MPRIDPLARERRGLFVRFVDWFSRRKLGKQLGKATAPGPLHIYAHHPGVLMAVGAFEMGAERWSAVPAHLKTLAQVRAATLIGCPF